MPRTRVLIPLAALLVGATVAVADENGRATQESTRTLYSSLPLQGPAGPQSADIVRAIRMALAEADGRAGSVRIRYRSLDDSTRAAGTWQPGKEAANARRAAIDRRTIAYIGAFNSPASIISMPILNQARILQVSPSNTYVGLTADEPGARPGEPDKYYPRGRRHYVRLIPNDTVQARALALIVDRRGCERLYVIHDRTYYGRGLATSTRRFARGRGVAVVGFRAADARQPRYRRLGRRVGRARADCVLYGGSAPSNAVQVLRDVAPRVPRAKLFGGDGLADQAVVDPRSGGLPARIARRVRLTSATLAPRAFGAAGKRFFRRFEARYGHLPAPYAIYGYESTKLALASIRRAGSDGDKRAAVIRAAFRTRGRRSVLGRYSIDSRGDTTDTDFGVYRIAGGLLVWDRRVRP